MTNFNLIIIFFILFSPILARATVNQTCLVNNDCRDNSYCNCQYQCQSGAAPTTKLLLGYFYYSDGFHSRNYINYNDSTVFIIPGSRTAVSQFLYNTISSRKYGSWYINPSNNRLQISHYQTTILQLLFDNDNNGYCVITLDGLRAYRPSRLNLHQIEQNNIYFANNSLDNMSMLYMQNQLV